MRLIYNYAFILAKLIQLPPLRRRRQDGVERLPHLGDLRRLSSLRRPELVCSKDLQLLVNRTVNHSTEALA